jgi:hypothetical protein
LLLVTFRKGNILISDSLSHRNILELDREDITKGTSLSKTEAQNKGNG